MTTTATHNSITRIGFIDLGEIVRRAYDYTHATDFKHHPREKIPTLGICGTINPELVTMLNEAGKAAGINFNARFEAVIHPTFGGYHHYTTFDFTGAEYTLDPSWKQFFRNNIEMVKDKPDFFCAPTAQLKPVLIALGIPECDHSTWFTRYPRYGS